MKLAKAILFLKGKKLKVDVLAGIGALADLAYDGLLEKERQAPLDGDQAAAKAALEEVFPYLKEGSRLGS